MIYKLGKNLHTKKKSHTLRLGYFKMPIKNKCSTEKSHPDPDDLHPKNHQQTETVAYVCWDHTWLPGENARI